MFLCSICSGFIEKKIKCPECKWKNYFSQKCLEKDQNDHKEYCNENSIPAKINYLMRDINALEPEYLTVLERVFQRFKLIYDDDMCIALVLINDELDDLVKYFDFRRFLSLLSYQTKQAINNCIEATTDDKITETNTYTIHIIASGDLFYSKVGFNLDAKFSYTRYYELTDQD